MREFIGGMDWTDVLSDDLTIDQCWAVIESKIRQAVDMRIPIHKHINNIT